MNTLARSLRDDISSHLRKAINDLRDDGHRAEDIAAAMEVSYNTVKNWITGRRVPKIPTVRRLEQLYGMKIL